MLFPALVSADDVYYHFSRLRNYIVELCEVLSDAETDDRRLSDLSKQFLNLQTQSKPLNFTTSDTENILLQMDRRFVEMCSLMENNGSPSPHLYSIVQFYAKIDYLQKEVAKVNQNK